MKKFLWVGSFSTDEVNKSIQELGYNNAAQFTAQKNLIEGLEKYNNISFDTIGAFLLPDDKLVKQVDEIRFSHGNNSYDVLAGYRNIRYLNRLTSTISVERKIKRYIKNINENDELIVFMYEMRSMCFEAAELIKKKHKYVKIYMLVPDLPLFMSGNYSKTKLALKKIEYERMKLQMKYIDKYILFAEPMAEYLKLASNRYFVMEGSLNIRTCEKASALYRMDTDDTREKIFMYSGILDESYGILNLINAFKELPDDYKLWITGEGPAAEKIRRISDEKKIIYYGYLSTKKEVLKLQADAMALINIRDPNEEYSKYCFPSKLFEYMMSGRPVLSTFTQGIPTEYFEYLIRINDISTRSIKHAVVMAANMTKTERDRIGTNAREFVIKNKNNIKQAEYISRIIL